MEEVQSYLTEALHLTRKHAIRSRRHGLAVTAKCMECGANGADHPERIEHEYNCRLAILLMRVGSTVLMKSKKKPVEAPDLDACTS